jgi:hypothetical protein
MGAERPSRRLGEVAAAGLPGALPSVLGFVTEIEEGTAREARRKDLRGLGPRMVGLPVPGGLTALVLPGGPEL